MKISLTNEEKEAIELYKNGEYQVMNQLLISDSNSEISLIREDVEKESIKITYDRETLIRDLKAIKVIYELLQKARIQRNKIEDWAFTRGTNLAEIERIKKEMFIDKMLDVSSDKSYAEKEYAYIWNEPAVMYIRGDKQIPYIELSEIEDMQISANSDVIISPFTKIKTIIDSGDLKIDTKVARTYNVTLEKQKLQGMPKEDKQNLYINILGNSDYINLKINEIVRLEKESNNIYENIRKLEQLIAKYEIEVEKKRELENYSEYEVKVEEENLERLKKEVNSLKNEVSQIYEKIKECTEYVTNWKKNITVYVMSECYDIDVKYKDIVLKPEPIFNIIEDSIDSKLEENVEEVKKEENELKPEINLNPNLEQNLSSKINLNLEPEIENDNNTNPTIEQNIEPKLEESDIMLDIEEKRLPEFNSNDSKELVEKMKEVTTSCNENLESIKKMIKNIGELLSKQQNHAKVAGTISGRYSALNNCFEMKKQAEILLDLNNKIYERIEYIYNFEKETAIPKLDNIQNVNIQVSTLINYLNNPKSSVGRTKINRFEEMAIIEENEFKRNIADLLRDIRGEAELKKLKDDLEIIEDKNPLQKLLGIFTGRNKLDEIMIEQIIIRQDAIKRTLARTLRLDYNYSIHELVAEIEMFVRENEDDELIEDDVKRLQIIEEELKQNFVILEEKVKDIINEREGRNLPIDDKITREELVELETYRFLKKYKYDEKEDKTKQIEYQDTTANEIARIVEYIKTSQVLSD